MPLYSYSIHHVDHGINAVRRAAPAASHLPVLLANEPDILGAFCLATCNRVELYIDAQHIPSGRLEATVRRFWLLELERLAADSTEDPLTKLPLNSRGHRGTIRHLFEVTCGLDSMVVGEREITGQVRRTLTQARDSGTASTDLIRTLEHALRASRQVASATNLSATGRSVVSVGLDLALAELVSCPTKLRCVLLGTGSFAGAVTHALATRSITNIAVFSRSGRADCFAANRGLQVASHLNKAVQEADLVVCCSGTGEIALTEQLVTHAMSTPRAGKLIIVDLALQHDVAPEVRALSGVKLITLDDISQVVGGYTSDQVELARQIITEETSQLLSLLEARQLDPAVVALRAMVSTQVRDEINRLPKGEITREIAEHALRRLAARLLHVPMVQARQAAAEGRPASFVAALATLYNLEIDSPESPRNYEIDPGTLDCGSCPATGYHLDDIAPDRNLGAL